jgi:luciferase family oxidoreductase group 1
MAADFALSIRAYDCDMSDSTPVRYSVLDLSPIRAGNTAAESFRNSLDLAQHAERWNFTRYWLAEHHNIAGIASAATAVLIGHIAGGTSRMRIGSGGIMLPNHAPLTIAEQFGTLESLFPGRIDLGIGRAPGGDGRTSRALRRGLGSDADTFPRDLVELINYFADDDPDHAVRAVPGTGLHVPVYLLGSSDFSARLAAELGLPFAFASHFAPEYLEVALRFYRTNFKPSQELAHPHTIVGVNVFAADSDEQARRLFTSVQQAFLNLIRRSPSKLPPPVDSMAGLWSSEEQAEVTRKLHYSVAGSPSTVRRYLESLIAATNADELIFTANIYDHPARLHSFEIAAEAMKQINQDRAAAVDSAVPAR